MPMRSGTRGRRAASCETNLGLRAASCSAACVSRLDSGHVPTDVTLWQHAMISFRRTWENFVDSKDAMALTFGLAFLVAGAYAIRPSWFHALRSLQGNIAVFFLGSLGGFVGELGAAAFQTGAHDSRLEKASSAVGHRQTSPSTDLIDVGQSLFVSEEGASAGQSTSKRDLHVMRWFGQQRLRTLQRALAKGAVSGSLSIVVRYFFLLQDVLWGSGVGPGNMAKKVLFDLMVFCPLIVVPYTQLLYKFIDYVLQPYNGPHISGTTSWMRVGEWWSTSLCRLLSLRTMLSGWWLRSWSSIALMMPVNLAMYSIPPDLRIVVSCIFQMFAQYIQRLIAAQSRSC